MKTRVLTTTAVLIAALVTPGPLNADSKGVLPPPSWDQQFGCAATDCPRFVVLSSFGGAAVLDQETGLVWEQSPSATTIEFADAQFACNKKTVGNRKGWRLPTVQELASLVDPSQANPALPAGHPFSNVQSAFYWSANTRPTATTAAWDVSFSDGTVFAAVDIFPPSNFIWCVRGGQGVDIQ